jgi:hypothetical protein
MKTQVLEKDKAESGEGRGVRVEEGERGKGRNYIGKGGSGEEKKAEKKTDLVQP